MLPAFHRDIGPLIQQGLVEFMEAMWGMTHVDDCMAQFVPQMFDGIVVRGLCRLVHFSAVLLLQIISHCPGTMRHSSVILAAKIISKVLLSKWCQGVPNKMSRYTTPYTFLSRSTRGDFVPQWNAPPQTPPHPDTEPPPAWTLAAWQSCWKRSPGSRRILMRPSTGYS